MYTSMSQTYNVVDSSSPSQISSNHTVDNTYTLFITFTAPTTYSQSVASNPSKRVRGFNRRFRPRLHEIVPKLRNLTDDDLEDLIDQRNRDDYDN
jgi:hypothetical protein